MHISYSFSQLAYLRWRVVVADAVRNRARNREPRSLSDFGAHPLKVISHK